MKRSILVAISMLFASILAVSTSAQVPAQAVNPKIGVIDTSAFGAKDGIKKYTAASDALDKEFAPLSTEIQGLLTRYNTLGTEIKKLQDAAASSPNVPIDKTGAQAKIDEYQSLEVTIKRKQEDGKARLDKRSGEVLGPIMQDIGKAINDYATQKGYALMLDLAKMADAGMVLSMDASKIDVTKDFIAFYNARPAGTATTATPK
jgi:Skp family chaperone for outer membrane proteins